jgi:hypothetical protein
MRRTSSIFLGLVRAVAAAALAGGCGSRQAEQTWETCVDKTSTVVETEKCEEEHRRMNQPGFTPYYHYYYYRSPSAPIVGHSLSGGSLTRPSGSVSHGSVTRGGFGSSATSHSSSSSSGGHSSGATS